MRADLVVVSEPLAKATLRGERKLPLPHREVSIEREDPDAVQATPALLLPLPP